MTKPNPKYIKFESYMNGWNAFCYDKKDTKNPKFSPNPYNPDTQKFSHDCWYQGYIESNGEYQVWEI